MGFDFFKINNNGSEITSTNYWTSPHAAEGLCYLSLNARTARLLVPPKTESEIPEMLKGAELVVITRGLYKQRDFYELMFDDGSDQPYCLFLQTAQADRLFSDDDRKQEIPFAIWTVNGKQAEMTARYRKAKKLPYLKPYKG